MNFSNPAAFWFLLLIPPVILLYFLKMRRREIRVSTNMFWRKALEELHANAPFQRLRKNLLLLLQLLILALVILGLGGPGIVRGGAEEELVVILLDGSASMRSRDVEPSRFERARELAADRIDGLGSGERAALILFHRKAEVLCPPTGTRRFLRDRLAAAEPTDGTTDVSGALRLAASFLPEDVPGEVLLLSDGAFPGLELDPNPETGNGSRLDAPLRDLVENRRIRYVCVGESTDNVGIVRMAARRAPLEEGQDQLLVSIQRFGQGDGPSEVSLELFQDGELARARKLDLEPGESRDVVFAVGRDENGVFEARLTSATGDALATDDTAHLVLRPTGTRRALLITEGNAFLERALLSLDRLEVAKILPGDFPQGLGGERYDLYFHDYDGKTADPLPSGGHVFLNARPSMSGIEFGEEVEDPALLDWNIEHPVTRFLNFSDVLVARGRPLTLPDSATELLVSDRGPLLAAFTGEGIRGLVVGFALRDSNWPLKLSFPLFLANARGWLLRSASAHDVATFRVGDVITLPAGDRAEVTLLDPEGSETRVPRQADGTVTLTDTDRTGVWALTDPDLRFSVNLTSVRESEIAPRPSADLGGTTIESDPVGVVRTRSFWKPIVLLALSLLLLEWYVYHRRSVL